MTALACLGRNLAIAGHLRGAYVRGHIFACMDKLCPCEKGNVSRIGDDGIDSDPQTLWELCNDAFEAWADEAKP